MTPNRYCLKCGAQLDSAERFCPGCGADTGRGETAGTGGSGGFSLALDQLAQAFAPRYLIIRQLGSDAISGAYLADDSVLDRRVVIKVFEPDRLLDEGARARYLGAARSAAKLDHPNIITVYEISERDELRYVAMKHVEGESLADVLRTTTGSPPALPHVARWATQIADALAYAHERGVIHGDVSPHSILIDRDDDAHISDFGFMLVLGDAPGVAIREGGTPRALRLEYTSPERIAGGEATSASDQYSLGALLYEMIAGRPPFTGSPQSIAHAHMHTPPPSLLELRPECPPALAQMVEKMLAKSPEKRFARLSDLSKSEDPSASVLFKLSAEPVAPRAAPQKEGAPERARPSGQDVRFTVYRPQAVRPEKWYRLVVFAYMDDTAVKRQPDHVPAAERVAREAKEMLGRDLRSYVTATEDSAAPVPRESELLFIPRIKGFRFNPPHAAIRWLDDVEHVLFKMQAEGALQGTTARGTLTVMSGPLLLAEISLAIHVGEGDEQEAPVSAPAYRKIFVSYSRNDEPIVRQLEAYAQAIGDRYLRDVTSLRAGEKWNDRLLDLIQEADVFQLFWSSNSLRSAFVEREWRYALGLRRPNFVRPFFWEMPFPEDSARGLPPDELRELNFQRVQLAPPVVPAPSPPPPRGTDDVAASPVSAPPSAAEPTRPFPQTAPPAPPSYEGSGGQVAASQPVPSAEPARRHVPALRRPQMLLPVAVTLIVILIVALLLLL